VICHLPSVIDAWSLKPSARFFCYPCSMLRKLCLILLALSLGPAVLAKEKYQQPRPVQLDRDGARWAEKTLKKMPLEEKIGQMLMVWARVRFTNLDSPQYLQLRDIMRQYHVGGFGVTVPVDGPFLLRSQPYEAAMLLNQLQRDSELPLIFAADFERGVAMRFYGATVFPWPMAFAADGSLEHAAAFGRITAEEARAIGVQWNFFPIADVNSNPANPIINTRAFGEDPQQVGQLDAAYIGGAHQGGMLATAKHFPGHGDTSTDSHLGLARVDFDRQHLEQVELAPFRQAIEAGVDAVMVSHLTVPALEPNPNLVATASPAIVTGLLKQKMGFQGLVVTDALDMGGLMRLYSGNANPSGAAAVAAVKAGNDLVLIPGDLDGAYRGLLQAVRSGEIPEAQIDASVRKILNAKASVGLHKARLVDIARIAEAVGRPENLALGQAVADAAVTLVRDNGKLLPLHRTSRGTSKAANAYLQGDESRNRVVAVVFTDDVRDEYGRVFERELRARIPDASFFWVDPNLAPGMSDLVLAAVDRAQAVIVPVYMVPTAGKAVQVGGELKNTVEMLGPAQALLRRILERATERTVVIALGSPYIASDFPEVQNYLCTYSGATVSEVSAVRALFGEVPIRGRLPVTIPSIAQRGAGMERPQVFHGGANSHAASRSPAAP
jgi:beta-N-acetylhexosaminidase